MLKKLFESPHFRHLLISLATVVVLNISVAAQGDRAAGVAAFNAGSFVRSVELFKKVVKANKNDADAWFVLGMSHLRLGKTKDAAKALQRSVDLAPQNDKFLGFLAYSYAETRNSKALKAAEASVAINPRNPVGQYVLGVLAYRKDDYEVAKDRTSLAIEADPNFAGAYRLRSLAYVAKFAYLTLKGSTPVIPRSQLLNEAVSDLENVLAKTSDEETRKYANEDIAPLRYFAAYYNRPENQIIRDPSAPPDPTITPLKIVRKDSPPYTDSARQKNVEGTLTLLGAFDESGKVGPVIVLKSLDPSLDYQAVQAAKKIKFQPASKNGKPITQVRRLEYTFDIR